MVARDTALQACRAYAATLAKIVLAAGDRAGSMGESKGGPPMLTRLATLLLLAIPLATRADEKPRHLLYVVAPGIRNLLEYGGAGILVFDRDHDFAFVKRIAPPASAQQKP